MNQNKCKRKRRRLSAETKWQIYQECQKPDAKIGEVLRAHGLYSSDLQHIRQTVEDGAIEALKQRQPGRRKFLTVPIEAHKQIQCELEEKEKALAEMTVLFTILKKKVNLE